MALFFKLSLIVIIAFAHLSLGNVVKKDMRKVAKKETMTQAEILAEADPESRFVLVFISYYSLTLYILYNA